MMCKSKLLRKIALIACGAFLFGCFPAQPAKAQFLGFTSPQSVQATLASNTACTGVAQIFTPQNLGQTQHFIAIQAGTATFIRAEIDGIDTAGNVYRISDQLRASSSNGANNSSVVGYGYYPKIQISVVCSGGNFTLTYAGASASFGPIVGSYSLGRVDKEEASGAAANANLVDTIQTPYGNSQGELAFSYVATGPAGSTITVACQGTTQIGSVAAFVLNIPATGNITYVFPVPATTCPVAVVTYSSGGASATTFNMEYTFTQPGTPMGTQVINPVQLGVNALTEPAAGTSVLSQIIETRGVREATLKAACTTGNYTVNVQTYAEDGSTTLALITPVTAIAAAANVDLSIGSEANPSTNTGTLSTTALVRFPQRALAFSFTNAGGAGTCTARLFLTY